MVLLMLSERVGSVSAYIFLLQNIPATHRQREQCGRQGGTRSSETFQAGRSNPSRCKPLYPSPVIPVVRVTRYHIYHKILPTLGVIEGTPPGIESQYIFPEQVGFFIETLLPSAFLDGNLTVLHVTESAGAHSVWRLQLC